MYLSVGTAWLIIGPQKTAYNMSDVSIKKKEGMYFSTGL